MKIRVGGTFFHSSYNFSFPYYDGWVWENRLYRWEREALIESSYLSIHIHFQAWPNAGWKLPNSWGGERAIKVHLPHFPLMMKADLKKEIFARMRTESELSLRLSMWQSSFFRHRYFIVRTTNLQEWSESSDLWHWLWPQFKTFGSFFKLIEHG